MKGFELAGLLLFGRVDFGRPAGRRRVGSSTSYGEWRGGPMAASASRKSRAKWLIPALAVMAVLAFGGPPATATVIDQQHYSGTDAFSESDCGFTLDHLVEFHGQFLLRVDPTGQAFLEHNKYWFREVITNPETEKWFVVSGNGLFKQIKATQVAGTIYEFVAIDAGQPFTIEDSAGNVIVRERGVVRITILFDTLGDFQPGGVFLGETDVVFHGPHPGPADLASFCEIAEDLTA